MKNDFSRDVENMIIHTQDEADLRAKQLSEKYNLDGVFNSADPQETAHQLWRVAITPFDSENYLDVLEIVELCYYLDPNYYYNYIKGIAYFYTDNEKEAIINFEQTLKLLANKAQIYQPLIAGLKIRTIKIQLYRMLIESYIRTSSFDKALAIWDNHKSYFDNETNPDVLIMIAQILGASERVLESKLLLDRATVLANNLRFEYDRNDSLAGINRVRLMLGDVTFQSKLRNQGNDFFAPTSPGGNSFSFFSDILKPFFITAVLGAIVSFLIAIGFGNQWSDVTNIFRTLYIIVIVGCILVLAAKQIFKK